LHEQNASYSSGNSHNMNHQNNHNQNQNQQVLHVYICIYYLHI
jgi:hypothetical protein